MRDGKRVVSCFVAERLKRSARSSPFAVYHVLSLSPSPSLQATTELLVRPSLARTEAETEMGGHFEWERKSGERCYVLQIHPPLLSGISSSPCRVTCNLFRLHFARSLAPSAVCVYRTRRSRTHVNDRTGSEE